MKLKGSRRLKRDTDIKKKTKKKKPRKQKAGSVYQMTDPSSGLSL